MRSPLFITLLFLCLVFHFEGVTGNEPSKVLIVDGRNNHNWRITTDSIRATLQSTGKFLVSVSTAPESRIPTQPRAPKSDNPKDQQRYKVAKTKFNELIQSAKERAKKDWENWYPDFKKYDCVVLNYNGQSWPTRVQEDFVNYVKDGGGILLVHAANNAFSNWPEFNDIIGIGWRKAPYGKAIKFDPETGRKYSDLTASNSAHGSKHPFQITIREPSHPIMRGLPVVWLHARDELYHNMRGPAHNLTILSSAFSDPRQRGTGKHEPITWEVKYGKGRAIVTSLGHFYRGERTWDALYCVGFQTIVARSCEYLATGSVSIQMPGGFPNESTTSIIPPNQVQWNHPHLEKSNGALSTAKEKKNRNPYSVLTPEEELTTFQIAPGYVAELVASEPQVEEPVLTVWDGNGAMYVAEMRSYMQDENGTGTKKLRNGRIKKLVDTDGDGRMDKVSVFVDKLNLPRMILPLDDWIAIRESDTMDVIAYRDSDGDGVADQKKPLFQYGPRSRNGPNTSVEHQDSGLIWNIDNYIYISYNMERYRYTDGVWRPQPQPGHWTQWGLTHDDFGRLYWIHNSGPLVSAQIHPKYWYTVQRLAKKRINGLPITLGDPYEPDFMKVKSLCLLNDRGGSAHEVRSFTSACGQSVFRGDKLPFEDRGRYFFVDPTIHVLRRSNIEFQRGKLMLTKAESENKEFLLSSDINCRFVNTATAPDGMLYVTDMYRGIIQDAPWMNPNARKFTRESGLVNNRLMGRIWRIRHKDFQPGKKPQMLGETTVELVRHLHHPNGWWRDTAQKLILLKDDRESVIPLLESTFRYTQNKLARLHALWTLEGMDAIPRDVLSAALHDKEPCIRIAGIRIAETKIEDYIQLLLLMKEDDNPRVVQQLINTLGLSDSKLAENAIQVAARNHLGDRGVMMSATISLWGKSHLEFVSEVKSGEAFNSLKQEDRSSVVSGWKSAIANWNRGLDFPKEMPKVERRHIESGERQYYQYCISCHGADGLGMKISGLEQPLAPALAESKRVQGDPNQLIPVFINGLTGPINDNNYAAANMAPAKALGITRDDRLAEILSYVRYAWGNKAESISKEEVTKVRKQFEHRSTPWTDTELDKIPKVNSK